MREIWKEFNSNLLDFSEICDQFHTKTYQTDFFESRGGQASKLFLQRTRQNAKLTSTMHRVTNLGTEATAPFNARKPRRQDKKRKYFGTVIIVAGVVSLGLFNFSLTQDANSTYDVKMNAPRERKRRGGREGEGRDFKNVRITGEVEGPLVSDLWGKLDEGIEYRTKSTQLSCEKYGGPANDKASEMVCE